MAIKQNSVAKLLLFYDISAFSALILLCFPIVFLIKKNRTAGENVGLSEKTLLPESIRGDHSLARISAETGETSIFPPLNVASPSAFIFPSFATIIQSPFGTLISCEDPEPL